MLQKTLTNFSDDSEDEDEVVYELNLVRQRKMRLTYV